MRPDDLIREPKLFCENIKLGYTPEYFVMALSSGDEIDTYALTPAHIKRLYEYLGHEVTKFEKEHGEISAHWNPNIVSPFEPGNPPTPES